MMQQINLYRPIFRKQEKKFSAITMLQASAAILVGIVIIYALMYWQVRSLRNDLSEADRQLASATKRLDDTGRQLGLTGGSSLTLEEETAKLEMQIIARQRVRDVLNRGLFSNTTGYSDYFIAFARQHVPGVWLTAFSIVGAGEEMRLQGRTTDPAQVPRYVQKLSSETTIVGKDFQVFSMSRPEKKEGQGALPSYVEFQFRTAPSNKEPGKS